MSMKQCASGHVYDSTKNPNCPYCSGRVSLGVARPLGSAAGTNTPSPPMIRHGMSEIPATAAYVDPQADMNSKKAAPEPIAFPKAATQEPRMNNTMPLNVNEIGINPVCGWLICISGEKKGRDFRIYSGRNFVGRMKSNDISLEFDSTVSKEATVIIIFDDRNNKFYIQPGSGKNNIYVNGELLFTHMPLKDYDTIEIGRTKLLFHSLCNEKFRWDELNEESN